MRNSVKNKIVDNIETYDIAAIVLVKEDRNPWPTDEKERTERISTLFAKPFRY